KSSHLLNVVYQVSIAGVYQITIAADTWQSIELNATAVPNAHSAAVRADIPYTLLAGSALFTPELHSVTTTE
ncbi:hypothetical protein ACQSED_27100, partial [Salmonella enterica]|uniref:hypothetical protein n=1 Tax=Salmonella enterica TaxID=28901 RepID=UPI003D317038